jgi:hypothetical protein
MAFYNKADALRANQYTNVLSTLTAGRIYVESPFDRQELDIYWSPLPPAINHGTLLGYNVYRARSPQPIASLEWKLLNPGAIPVTINLFRDLSEDPSYLNVWWYRVQEIYSDGFTREVDAPTNLNSRVNSVGTNETVMSVQQITREWRRRKYVILRRTSELVQLLVKRVAGEHCKCFDPEYESGSKDVDCPECFGTGWTGGYEVLTDIFMRILEPPETLQVRADALTLVTTPKAWLVDFPIVRDGDIVVRRNNWRYEVKNPRLLMTQGILTEQQFDIDRRETTDIVYTFPLVP